MNTIQKCHCGSNATVYAGGSYAGDWAGAYCDQHIPAGFQIWDRFDNEGSTEMQDESATETINVATEEGRRRLAEVAADGPVFRVLHACDSREGVCLRCGGNLNGLAHPHNCPGKG